MIILCDDCEDNKTKAKEGCDPCPDEIDPETQGWLACPEPPFEMSMVNSVILPPGFQLAQFVDIKDGFPVVNEELYKKVMALYPGRFLFQDGSGLRKSYTREEWIEKNKADPLAQLAWQRKNAGVVAEPVAGAGTVTIKPKPGSPEPIVVGGKSKSISRFKPKF